MNKRTVVITGAKGGLGSFVIRRFLQSGDNVIGASRSIHQSDFPDENFMAIQTDFSNFESVQQLTQTVISKFGRIDVLVHVVGGFAGGTPLHETDEQTWASMLDQNLTSAFHVIRAVVPHMRAAGSGCIIAIGSHAAEQPHANIGAYVISKAALVTLIRTVALENKDKGITVNAVLPGTMDTPANRTAMPSANRSSWVSPAEVAEAIFWLTSDAASKVNGAAIPVSGRDV